VKWPGNSSDLDPINPIKAWMKKKLEDNNCTILQQQKETILKVWLEKTDECIPAEPGP
jgi:hypothetical protein